MQFVPKKLCVSTSSRAFVLHWRKYYNILIMKLFYSGKIVVLIFFEKKLNLIFFQFSRPREILTSLFLRNLFSKLAIACLVHLCVHSYAHIFVDVFSEKFASTLFSEGNLFSILTLLGVASLNNGSHLWFMKSSPF